MKIEETLIYKCEKCGMEFNSIVACEEHEQDCTYVKLGTIYCYLIPYINTEIIKTEDIHPRVIELNNAYKMKDELGVYLFTNDEDDKLSSLSNYISNFDDVKNGKVFFNGLNIYTFSFEYSDEIKEKCIQRLIDYKINQLIERKESIEKQIGLLKQIFN